MRWSLFFLRMCALISRSLPIYAAFTGGSHGGGGPRGKQPRSYEDEFEEEQLVPLAPAAKTACQQAMDQQKT